MKIYFSSGEYDDYSVHMYCEVPNLEWIKTKLQQWVDEHPESWKRYNFKPEKFVDWLVSHDECKRMDLEFTQCFLGTYHCLEVDESIRPTKKRLNN